MNRNLILTALLVLCVWLVWNPSAGAIVRRGGYYHNSYTGRSYGYRSAYNPYTGGAYRGSAYHNSYTGRTGGTRSSYNPYTNTYRRSAAVYNPYTGRYAYGTRAYRP